MLHYQFIFHCFSYSISTLLITNAYCFFPLDRIWQQFFFFIVGIFGKGDEAQTETHALLDYAGPRFRWPINKKNELVNKWILLFQQTTEWKWKKMKKMDIYLDLARELKKLQNISNSDTNCYWSAWNGFLDLGKEIGGIEDQRKIQNHPDHITVKIH